MTPQRLHAGLRNVRRCRSYVLGALHDGTVRKRTVRIAQKEESYVLMIRNLIRGSGSNAWTYREGRSRDIYVVEFSRSFLQGHSISSRQDAIDYLRGFFDTDGSVASHPSKGRYVYFAQKDRADLEEARQMLSELGIECGRIHNPSRRADPEYWRFYVRRQWVGEFAKTVGSWHPRKAERLRMVIQSTPHGDMGRT